MSGSVSYATLDALPQRAAPSRRQVVGLVALALAAVAASVLAASQRVTYLLGFFPDDDTFWPRLALGSLVALSYLFAGIAAWVARPVSRTGPILYLAGLLFLLPGLGDLALPWLSYVAYAMDGLWLVAAAIAVVTYPTGRLEGFARWLAIVAIGWNAVVTVMSTVIVDTTGCLEAWCVPNAWFVELGPMGSTVYPMLNDLVSALLWLGFVALLVGRWRHASPLARRWSWPLWLAGIALAMVHVANTVVARLEGDGSGFLFTWVLADPLSIVVPISLAWGIVRGRLAQASVGDLLLELGQEASGDRWRDAMGRALGDPEVVVAVRGPAGQLVELDGRPVADLHGRVVTPVHAEAPTPIYLVHDPGLAANPGLVRAVAAATGLAMDNRRLSDEVERQLEEVRASRARIVEASDAQRARVERDLHDGAQQRLVSLALRIRLLAGGEADPGIASSYEALADELDGALRELRELARGIHPAALVEGGLLGAVDGLAARSPIAMEVAVPDQRWPSAVESAAWFVIGEATTNAARHAHARLVRVSVREEGAMLVVEVRDDGVGGADVGHGSGLGGLVDRVAAQGGTLGVTSPPGEGTSVVAHLPLSGSTP